MKILTWTAVVASVWVLGACGSGSGGTTAQQAAQTFCNQACSCSSTCTVATADSSNQPKDPQVFGSASACEAVYAPLLGSDSGAIDPSACAAAAPSAQCLSDSTGGHFLVPPSSCRVTVAAADAATD